MINQLIITIFAALATGGAVVTSQYLGAQKPEDAARSAGQLIPQRPAGHRRGGVLLLTRTVQLRLFFGSIEEDVMAAALLYFTITALSFPFLALYNAGAAVFRCIGNSAVSMQIGHLMNIINFVRQCGLHLCAEHGGGRCCRAHPGIPRCGGRHHPEPLLPKGHMLTVPRTSPGWMAGWQSASWASASRPPSRTACSRRAVCWWSA